MKETDQNQTILVLLCFKIVWLLEQARYIKLVVLFLVDKRESVVLIVTEQNHWNVWTFYV